MSMHTPLPGTGNAGFMAGYLEALALVERLHRLLLDVIKDEFERVGVIEINAVQALLLFNIGDNEVTAGELKSRGYYQGSNVSYNLKKLVEMGYMHHQRCEIDRRSVRVRLTENLDNKAAILRVASISKGGESQRASAIWLVIQDGYIPMPFVSRKLMSAFIFSSGSALKPDESWSTPGAGAGGLLGIVRVDLDTEVLDPPDIPDPPIPVNPIPVIPHVIPSPKPPPRRVSVEADVLFGFDSSRIKPEAAARLFDVLAEIERRGRPDVLIEGHTDSVGSDEYNEGLSVRRAEAVRQWFREHLAPGAASFRVEGKGEEENIASNSTAAGRARNRRVEIVIS